MIKKVLLEILLWTWCLPQTLLGLIVKVVTKGYKLRNYKNANIYVSNIASGSAVSLGKYILCSAYSTRNAKTIQHEYGHFLQSLMLGWLYLPIVGLPSFIWANSSLLAKYRVKHKISYYSKYPENWADKLGKVER